MSTHKKKKKTQQLTNNSSPEPRQTRFHKTLAFPFPTLLLQGDHMPPSRLYPLPTSVLRSSENDRPVHVTCLVAYINFFFFFSFPLSSARLAMATAVGNSASTGVAAIGSKRVIKHSDGLWTSIWFGCHSLRLYTRTVRFGNRRHRISVTGPVIACVCFEHSKVSRQRTVRTLMNRYYYDAERPSRGSHK